jgi:hypothetical protein
MPNWKWFAVAVLCGSMSFAAAQLTEKWQKRLDAIEETYSSTILKSDKARMVSVQKANADRVRAIKVAQTDATKRFDVDAATLKAINDRLAKAEQDAIIRVKPEGTTSFGGHQYALIPASVTWHLAKRQCEEMGGYLVVVSNPQEREFIVNLCRKQKSYVWVGATDEEVEGTWKWVDGTSGSLTGRHINNSNGVEHYLAFDTGLDDFNDLSSGRCAFLCEWN